MIPSVQEIADRFSRLLAREAMPPSTPPTPATADVPPARSLPPSAGPAPVDYAARGIHLEVNVRSDEVVPAARLLDEFGFALDAVTGLDWMAQEAMEVVYDYFHPRANLRVAVRCRVPRTQPEVPTISGVYPGANWHERETHEFFGIRFAGHPQLIPLLLPEDADFHPLRKDFAA